jgi:RNA polymerase sigma factor for flagellar operon FliA
MASAAQLTYQEGMNVGAQERERLILEHLPQVRWIASRIHDKLPDSTSLEDLISTGVLGLIAAIDKFDPSYNAKLATYAEHKIRGAILDSIRGLDGIASHKRKRVKETEAVIAALEQRLQRAPREEEIANEVGLSVEEYRDWLLDSRGLSIGSLDAPLDSTGSSTLLNYIADRDDDSPARQLERAELERLLAESIEAMPPSERTVLSLYYHEELNLREIAAIMKLHITRISQLKTQGILRLRTQIDKRWPHAKGIYR